MQEQLFMLYYRHNAFMKDRLKEVLKKILDELGISDIDPVIEQPADMSHGDYTTNVALQLKTYNLKHKTSAQGLKLLEQSPRQIVEYIKEHMENGKWKMENIDHIDIAGPGFINFWIAKEELLNVIVRRLWRPEQSQKKLKGKKIMFEYGDANTHKFPHIGHLFSYIYGESVVRFLEEVGNDVRRVCYQGDIGLHVAKCLWAYIKDKPADPDTLEEKILLLQKMYQEGSQAFDDSKEAQQEIKDLNRKIYEKDIDIYNLWQKTRGWSVEYYKNFEQRLGIIYQRHYYESEVYEKGRKIVEENVGNVFTKSEGAVVFLGSKFGLHDRVFLTQYGTPTYEAKDMYLQKQKMEEWPLDLLIITTANEQNGYFNVIFRALEELDPIYKGKLKHLGFGMVKLNTGKISSRSGKIIGAQDLIDLTVAKVKELIATREELDNKEIDGIAEIVGIGAIKYAFLKSNYLQDIQFNLEESISIEGNSGPYLQYTFARTQSVLRKAEISNFQFQISNFKSMENEELLLLRTLYQFEDTVAAAAEKYSPSILCNYLYTLASQFNLFYQKLPILKAPEEIADFRLALTNKVGKTIKQGLYLLGIEAPERM
jgi:arginyl-tRNA synthetase